jgi:Zn-dependent peptidase ImmA (M78 family)
MRSREELARVALRAALETRREANTAWNAPICIYDLVESLGTEVWFVGGPSFAGMYAKGYGRLFVPAERPAGRKAFTCAHEFAHLRFGHGSRVEELDFDRSDHEVPEEILANAYAAYLLMPRHAVFEAFKRRNLEPGNADPVDVYAVACQLGVGFETLLKHLRWSLNLISHSRMLDLLAIQPKEIRGAILGQDTHSRLMLAGKFWQKVAIDLEVSDFAIVPPRTTLHGQSARIVGDCRHGQIVEALQPGLTQALGDGSDWAAMVRVSRKQFTGRGAYRHLEDPDENH